MQKIAWTEAATVDLLRVKTFFELADFETSKVIVATIREKAESLILFPNRGRPTEKENTRELLVSPFPFILIYTVEGETVRILRVLHTSQDR